jgi:hypothetical protein
MNSGRGHPTHLQEKGPGGGSRGVNSGKGWRWGFAGVRFFALDPYFLSMGFAGVALISGNVGNFLCTLKATARKGSFRPTVAIEHAEAAAFVKSSCDLPPSAKIR